MAIEKIVFMVENAFSERDYVRLGIEQLKSKGFEVEALDLFWVLSPHLHHLPYYQKIGRHTFPRLFHSKAEIIESISSEKKRTLYISLLGVSFKTRFIFRAIQKKRGILAVASLNSIIFESEKKRNYVNLLIKTFRNFRLFIEQLSKIIPRKYLGIADADYILIAGNISKVKKHQLFGPKTKFIEAHSYDYDSFLDFKTSKLSTSIQNETGGMCLYLDELMADHPDFNFLGITSPVTKDVFDKELAYFFNNLIGAHFQTVKVANHPRSILPPGTKKGQVEYISGDTLRLLSECSLALAHCSTSIQFAVMLQKPILFILTDQLAADKTYGTTTIANANALGMPILNISKQDDIAQFNFDFKIDENAYRRYFTDYIKCNLHSGERKLWDLLSDKFAMLE